MRNLKQLLHLRKVRCNTLYFYLGLESMKKHFVCFGFSTPQDVQHIECLHIYLTFLKEIITNQLTLENIFLCIHIDI